MRRSLLQRLTICHGGNHTLLLKLEVNCWRDQREPLQPENKAASAFKRL
jgi:hypothetical protein